MKLARAKYERVRICPNTSVGNDSPSRQTRDSTKERLERLAHMVRDEVFVDLDHSPPRFLLVGKFCFTTNTDDPRVIRSARDQAIERVGSDTRIGVDNKHVLEDAAN